MEDVNNLMNFADMVNANENIKPLLDIIEQIMALPEEALTSENIEVIQGMMRGAITDNVRKESIKELINNFETNNLNRKAATKTIAAAKGAIKEAIEELKPSPAKEAVLNGIFALFYEIFDEALLKYHNYAIELPIKLDENAQMPMYAHDTDACADIYASQDITLPAHSLSNKVHTGLHIALPESWVFMVEPRSSIGYKTGLRLSNSMGIIDEDYRGEICILYDNISDSDYEIKAGDRIAQIWVERVERFKPVTVNILPTTERGEGGFGSSGK